jgi:phage/plasmid-like protein (TIGR03299 family)
VLRLGGVSFEVEQAKDRFFAGGEWRDSGKFVNFRNDTFEPLGVVGKVYKPFQPVQSFKFLEDVTGKYGLTWESAGLTASNRLFVTVKLPEDIEIDIDGVKDIIQPHLAVLDSWDGNSSMTALVTPWRIRCGNTERFAVRDAASKWTVRHTTNALDRVEEARNSLGLSVKYLEVFKAEEQKLAQTDLEIAEFRSLIDGLWEETEPRSEQTVRTRNKNERRDDVLEGMWGAQVRETGRNAYSAERVVTDYLDHVAPRLAVGDKLAAARATAILEGADDDKKTKAHRQLLTLTNR